MYFYNFSFAFARFMAHLAIKRLEEASFRGTGSKVMALLACIQCVRTLIRHIISARGYEFSENGPIVRDTRYIGHGLLFATLRIL